MPRPQVVLNVFSSLDGRITTSLGRNVAEWTLYGMDGDANRLTHEYYDKLGCDALIGGSESIMVFGNHWVDLGQRVPMPKAMDTFIVVDGRGRIGWTYTEGLIVVTRKDVDASYIQQLSNKQIRYIQTGREHHVDLVLALERLYEFGIRKIGLSGGGTLNGAFLRAGLIDEVSILFAPVVVGGKDTPTLFDCDDAIGLDDLTPLELINVESVGQGTVWTHYRVSR